MRPRMVLKSCVARQSYVYRVLEWTENAALRGSGAHGQYRGEVPILTTWGLPVRKPRIQLQREEFNPRILSLGMSLVGTR